MKRIIYLCAFVYMGVLFGCSGSSSSSAGNADSTIATDSGAAPSTSAPATDQSASQPATPATEPPAPANVTPQEEASAPSAPKTEVTTQQFYDELSPYGKWVNYPEQGYVWQPTSAGQDFQPYSTNGHWVYSNEGWTWASDYKWGWAAFHYGSWFHEAKYGWLWKPGTEWAPAQVTWGQSGNYYGWAPLEPNVRADARWTPPATTWNFVPKQNIDRPDVVKYVVNKNTNTTIVKNVTVINNITNNNRTTVVNNNNNKTVVNNNKTVNNNKVVVKNNTTVIGNKNTVYNKGPQVNEVEKVTNKKITQVNINDDNKPGQTTVRNNKLVIYRPVVRDDPKAKKPAPRNAEQAPKRGK